MMLKDQDKILSGPENISSSKLSNVDENYTSVEQKDEEKILPSDPIKNLLVSLPPLPYVKRLSPWWPQYRDAIQIEYDGHIKMGPGNLSKKRISQKEKIF